jgi:hypothetical protein
MYCTLLALVSIIADAWAAVATGWRRHLGNLGGDRVQNPQLAMLSYQFKFTGSLSSIIDLG